MDSKKPGECKRRMVALEVTTMSWKWKRPCRQGKDGSRTTRETEPMEDAKSFHKQRRSIDVKRSVERRQSRTRLNTSTKATSTKVEGSRLTRMRHRSGTTLRRREEECRSQRVDQRGNLPAETETCVVHARLTSWETENLKADHRNNLEHVMNLHNRLFVPQLLLQRSRLFSRVRASSMTVRLQNVDVASR